MTIIQKLRKRLPSFIKKRIPQKVKNLFPPVEEPESISPPKRENPGEKRELNWDRYEELWQSLFGHRQEDYFRMHKVRYFELMESLARSYALNRKLRVLDIGVTELAELYLTFFPGMRLVTVDRPVSQFGFKPEYCRENLRVERHYQVDLNKDFLAPEYGSPPLSRFDYIICTEVIEHLLVNPVVYIRSLIGLLNPGGRLYLTTPNFFRFDNLEKIKRRENPQMVYPPPGENIYASYHFREYEMNEMIGFIRQAGGRVLESSFSGCWDAPELLAGPLKENPEQKGNLVFLIGKEDDSQT